ncbi:MAG: four helix bundle protein [Kofleriaceae bacterium]|nr:four helix bundle protein [Kofleriaceae bacterium]
MFGFQNLDVYKCANAFLPKAYAFAGGLDGEMASQLRRAALSINLNIAEGSGRFDKDQRRFYLFARGSALECAAILDAAKALGKQVEPIEECLVLLDRIVAMLTKMAR